jgi:epoxyqueuosine reductase
VLKELAGRLVERIAAIAGRPVGARIFVDSSPLAERAVAERAGLGWFGKNTMLLLPGAGSWAFLCEVILDLALDADQPVRNSCGRCQRCLDVCPTGALVAPGVLDNRLCISFLTIELKDRVPRAQRPLLGSWIFGCDDCQEVCPVNRKAPSARLAALRAYDDEAAFPRLLPLLSLTDASFKERYRGSAVLRAKRWGLQRNACIALGNLRDPVAIEPLERLLLDEAAHPLVREHAAWALWQFSEPAARRALERGWQSVPRRVETAAPTDGIRDELALALGRPSE